MSAADALSLSALSPSLAIFLYVCVPPSRIGLGVMGYADMLMKMAIPYNTPEVGVVVAVAVVEAVAAE